MLPGGKILFKTGKMVYGLFFRQFWAVFLSLYKPKDYSALKNQKPKQKTHTINKYQRVVSV